MLWLRLARVRVWHTQVIVGSAFGGMETFENQVRSTRPARDSACAHGSLTPRGLDVAAAALRFGWNWLDG